MTMERESSLMQRVKIILDHSVDELDQQTILRLQRARLDALTPRPSSTRWMFAGTLATLSIAVLALTLWMSKPVTVMPVHEPNDLEVVTAAENLEFYDEIDFYRWLADHHGES